MTKEICSKEENIISDKILLDIFSRLLYNGKRLIH